MKVTVRCFAAVREVLGHDVVEVELAPGTTVRALKEALARTAPALGRQAFAVAVNRAYADAERVLDDGDEVAFIPPISGGVDAGHDAPFAFLLQEEALDPRRLEALVRSDQDGAIVTFLGVTRDHNDGQAVRELSYEAYPEMAQRVVEDLLAEAARTYAIGRARVAHRLGAVPIGEASVVVCVAAPHRGPAFDACRFLIDRLKLEAPIFKRERLRDPGSDDRWVGDLPAGKPQV